MQLAAPQKDKELLSIKQVVNLESDVTSAGWPKAHRKATNTEPADNQKDELNTAKDQSKHLEQLVTKCEKIIDDLENHLLHESKPHSKQLWTRSVATTRWWKVFPKPYTATTNAFGPSKVNSTSPIGKNKKRNNREK
jgi:hypothetical protein